MASSVHLFLTVLPGTFAIARLAPSEEIPGIPSDTLFYSVTRTPEECSLVCDENLVGPETKAERGRSMLRVDGPLDFSLTGVLASLAAPLAEAKISIFVLSSYDTDYLLLAQKDLERAVVALEHAGHKVKRSMEA